MTLDNRTTRILDEHPGLEGPLPPISAGRGEAQVTWVLRMGFEAIQASPMPQQVAGTTRVSRSGRGLGCWEGLVTNLSLPHPAVTIQLKKAVPVGKAREKPAAIAFQVRTGSLALADTALSDPVRRPGQRALPDRMRAKAPDAQEPGQVNYAGRSSFLVVECGFAANTRSGGPRP
jgi:hypothetical protein